MAGIEWVCAVGTGTLRPLGLPVHPLPQSESLEGTFEGVSVQFLQQRAATAKANVVLGVATQVTAAAVNEDDLCTHGQFKARNHGGQPPLPKNCVSSGEWKCSGSGTKRPSIGIANAIANHERITATFPYKQHAGP